MRKLILIFVTSFLVSAPTWANIGPLNNQVIVTFDLGNKETDYFYCKVNSNHVSNVEMQNHHVLIDGFNSDGKAVFSGRASLTKLNHVYFKAKSDDNSLSIMPSVHVNFNGNEPNGIECFNGTGGRHLKYGAFLP